MGKVKRIYVEKKASFAVKAKEHGRRASRAILELMAWSR